ncbi:MAG: glycosyltransferase family 2 protein [Pyrinomonadaceae bacterium]
MLATVIIPTFNRAEKITRAIESARAQTFPHKQIIVVDDGSTDNTAEIVSKYPDVEYFYQKNQRQAAARNAGLKLAKGDYIATLDSDDVWNKDFLARSIDCLERHDLDFVFSSWTAKKNRVILPSAWEISNMWKPYTKNPSGEWYLLSPEESRELFIKTCPAPSSSLLIRKDSIVSNWNPELIIADDWCFILDMVLKKPCRAAFTLDRLWEKEVHRNNIYDGRNRGEIAKELEIHDTRIMKTRHLSRLSSKEKLVLNRRIIRGYIVRVLFFGRDRLGLRNPGRLFRSKLEVSE